LDIVGNLNLQKVSNTASIKLNSNVVTEYTRSKKLIKYPRVAITANSSGGYVASASSELSSNYRAWEAFNNIFPAGHDGGTEGWISADGTYSSTATNGEYLATGTNTFSGAPSGEQDGSWIKLQLPTKIKLNHLVLKQRYAGSGQEYSVNVVVYASVDNSSWHSLGTFDPLGSETFTFYTNTSYYYNYFVLHVKSVNHPYGYTAIEELEYYGTPEYDPDAHGTDVVVRSVPNVPNTDWLEVYYDGQDYTSMPVTVTDKSGNGVTGTPNGGVGFDTEYKAFTFDRVDDYVTGSITASGNFVHSISMWFKPNVVDSSIQMLFFMSSNGGTDLGRSIIFFDSASGIGFDFRSKSIRYLVPPVANQWMHLVCTYDGNLDGSGSDDMKIYINGIKVTNTVVSGASSTLNLINGTFWIGNTTGSSQHFGGSIANFRLFNRALTADEVWQLYAYQKEYFGHGNLGMTLKGGRLGIGTSEPRALLDVRGDIVGGCPVLFSANRNSVISGAQSIVFQRVHYNKGGGYSGTTGKFTAPLPGYYKFSYHDLTRQSTAATNVQAFINGTQSLPNSSGTGYYGVYDDSTDANYRNLSGNWIVYLNAGDTFELKLTEGTLNSNFNCFNGFYLST
jgi:hypothetical protein